MFSTYLGGTFDDLANGVRVDAAGNIHVAGRTESDDFPTVEAMQSDAFVARITAAGELSYSTFLGGEDWELVHGLDVDDDGAVYSTSRGARARCRFRRPPARSRRTSWAVSWRATYVPFGADHNCFDMHVSDQTPRRWVVWFQHSTFIGYRTSIDGESNNNSTAKSGGTVSKKAKKLVGL